MLIWDYIRDFLVMNIFGGYTSSGEMFGGCIGQAMFVRDGAYEDDGLIDTGSVWLWKIADNGDGLSYSIGLGDWLSTTTTIIIMVLAVVLMCLLVRWVWRVVSSAMLLK